MPGVPAHRWLAMVAVAVGTSVLVQGLYAVSTLASAWNSTVIEELGGGYIRDILLLYATRAAVTAVVTALACTAVLAARPVLSWLHPFALVSAGTLVAALAVSLVFAYAVWWTALALRTSDGSPLMQALINWPQLVAMSLFPTAAAAWTLLRPRRNGSHDNDR
ncbi:hypothetical protein [Streptomyces sp. N35]|uniref:hypothetical protein n=1 Tax=Streptomyces sp. N35 TaxID=2795730 RepID=UPI0018F61DA8|nr:hypothetical protein [Streptomyces sp. N35]